MWKTMMVGIGVVGLSIVASASPLLTLALVQFQAADGSEGILTVVRNNQSALGAMPVFKTTLYYSFCLTPVPSCLNGYGTIPNSVFKGNVSLNYQLPDVLTLVGDSNNWTGYVNEICYLPDENAVCQGGQYLVSGGAFNLKWTKIKLYANIDTTTSKSVQPDGTVTNASHQVGNYSAQAEGSVLGALVAGGFQTKVGFVTGSYTQSAPTVAATLSAMGVDEKAVSRIRKLEKKCQSVTCH